MTTVSYDSTTDSILITGRDASLAIDSKNIDYRNKQIRLLNVEDVCDLQKELAFALVEMGKWRVE